MAIEDKKYDKLIKDVGKVNKKLLIELDKILIDLSNKGVLEVNDNLAELEEKTRKALKDAGYPEAMQNFFEVFPQLAKNIFDEYKIAEIKSKRRDGFETYAKQKLTGSEFNAKVVGALTDNIREGSFLNKTYSDQKALLRDLLVEKGLVTNYVASVADTLLGQYRGTISQDIFDKYQPKEFAYIASTIETTRPFCDHLKDFGGRISVEQLKKSLDEYCPNGIPSETRITYETVNDKKLTREKGSGMIDGTTFENFSVVRGGWRCRHEVRWFL
jgi:hypothetical protein